MDQIDSVWLKKQELLDRAAAYARQSEEKGLDFLIKCAAFMDGYMEGYAKGLDFATNAISRYPEKESQDVQRNL